MNTSDKTKTRYVKGYLHYYEVLDDQTSHSALPTMVHSYQILIFREPLFLSLKSLHYAFTYCLSMNQELKTYRLLIPLNQNTYLFIFSFLL